MILMTAKSERDLKFEKDLITGLISLILLAIIKMSKEPLYGYQIAKRMEEVNETGIDVKQGTIYPVLRSLEKKALLTSEIKASESGPPRKYYKITKKGMEKLKVWKKAWKNTSMLVDNVMKGDY